MQQIKRKRRSPWPKWLRLVISAVLLILIGLLFFFVRKHNRPMPKLDPQRPQTEVLFSAEPEDLRQFTIKPAGAPAYTVARTKDGLKIKGKEDFPLDEDSIQNMLSNMLHVTTLSNFGDIKHDPIPLEQLGLDDRALRVDIELSDGSSFAFSIGDRVPGTDIPQDYLLLSSGDILYGIDTDMRYALERKLESLHPVPRLDFTADLMDRFTIKGKNQTLMIERITADLWEMREPYSYPVSLSSEKQLLGHIKDMRLASFVASADEAALRTYGLDAPRYVIQMDLAASTIASFDDKGQPAANIPVAAQQITLDIGHEIPDIGFYCRYRDGIYQASDLSMGFLLNIDPKHYISPQALDIPLNLVKELSFSLPNAPAQKYQIELVEHILRSGDFAKDETGEQLYNYHVSFEGASVDPAPLAALYTGLMNLSGFGEVSKEYQPAEHSALLSLKVRYAIDRERTISFHPYDALHAALVINGKALYLIETSSLSSLIAALQDGSLHNAPAQTDIP